MHKKWIVYLLLAAILSVNAFIPPASIAASAQNLASGKTVFASGNEVDWLTPENAVDGNLATRWSSALQDDQWFYVDLGEVMKVARVVIQWQTPAETYTKSLYRRIMRTGSTSPRMTSSSPRLPMAKTSLNSNKRRPGST